MPNIAANGITIEYEDHGKPDDPVILLVMGLGGQLTLWPIEFVEALVARGFRVIRYDNRDIGLSTKFDGVPVPNPKALFLRSFFRIPTKTPYRLGDMAKDGMGLLDALGIKKAHIVGASMGGMISQHIAARFPERVLSLTSIMSTSGRRGLPGAKPEAMAIFTKRPMGGDAEMLIEFSKNAARVIGSPGYPSNPERLDRRVRADYERSYYPVGVGRQLAAIIVDGDRTPLLRTIKAPTLVIHGEDDPLVPLEAGKDTAANIPGARLMTIPGMGHDLPLALVDTMADAIADHAKGAAVAA